MQNQTFKAAALFKQKNKLKIIDLEFPKKLHRGQVFVKIIRFAICGAQINEINGVKGEDKYLPHLMGHEGYGEIIKIGPSVKKFKKKQKVILHWRKGRGINAKPFVYFSRKYGKINSGQVTTFSQYSVVSENRLSIFDTKKKYENLAPLLGCCLPTAYFLLKKTKTLIKIKDIIAKLVALLKEFFLENNPYIKQAIASIARLTSGTIKTLIKLFSIGNFIVR